MPVIPAINLDHIQKLTTDFGIVRFAKNDEPDLESGYTLDDNARAMIALCHYVAMTGDRDATANISIYLRFIMFCQQPDGSFLNFVDKDRKFTEENKITNLADSNGMAIWAIGYLISLENVLPISLTREAVSTMHRVLVKMPKIHSTLAMAFVIKGLYYRNKTNNSPRGKSLIRQLANRLVQMYKHEAAEGRFWFEAKLDQVHSVLPEAMLCAWLANSEPEYKEIAKSSFDYMLGQTFEEDKIKIISKIEMLKNGSPVIEDRERPIDVAYTIIALKKFFDVYKDENYSKKMELAFNWFLGDNRLQQEIYNPATGGCYEGIETDQMNTNQGAESTISYLLARLTVKEALRNELKNNGPNKNPIAIPESLAALPENKN